MSLKKAIVVRSEYTIKTESGGSRGATPGNFILEYMSRDDATEKINIMLMNTAENPLSDDYMDYIYGGHKLNGVAFDEHSLSLSKDELIEHAKSVQKAFEEGKTVMKTVISFDEEYLREHGIIPDEFELRYKGDFKGNTDQMKLRHAISTGIEFASEYYDDLSFVATMQVDTRHIHCHLVLVDMGDGNITEDGTQKGKLSAQVKNKIRHGIDAALNDTDEIHFMDTNFKLHNDNKRLIYENHVYRSLNMYSAPQAILTVLPDDKDLWYAGSGHAQMEKADRLCRQYVENIFDGKESGYNAAMMNAMQYTELIKKKYEHDEEQESEILQKKREELIKDGMNGVYDMMKESDFIWRKATQIQNYAVQDNIQPSFKNDLQDFVYKMRTYTDRYNRHSSEAARFSGFIKEFEHERKAENVSEDSYMLYDYFRTEFDYQDKLADKYSRFISIDRPVDEYMEEYAGLRKKAKNIGAMQILLEDENIKKMTEDDAEYYGRRNYDVYGSQYIVSDPELFKEKIRKAKTEYEEEHGKFMSKLENNRLELVIDEDGQPKIRKIQEYSFDEIKGLDLHDVKRDFGGGLDFSNSVRDLYVDTAKKRVAAYDNACMYLDRTGQSELKEQFDRADVELMRKTLNDIVGGHSVEYLHQPDNLPDNQPEPRKTIMLDTKTHKDISMHVHKLLMSGIENGYDETIQSEYEPEF